MRIITIAFLVCCIVWLWADKTMLNLKNKELNIRIEKLEKENFRIKSDLQMYIELERIDDECLKTEKGWNWN